MAVKLIYGDIALGAAENATVEASDKYFTSAPEKLPFGVSTGAVTTCELNGWGLSHDYKVMGGQQFALWSSAKSDEDCVFATPPTITIDFSERFTATGLTLRFSPLANEYCRKLSAVWYQGDAVKDSGTFYPTTANYTLENTVEAFDKIIISLEETSLPDRRAKLEYIGIGIIREFDGEELTGASFVHEIDLISNTVPINVLDASFHSSTDTEYLFQKKQPVEAYNDENLIGVYYIEKGERTGARDYSISCQDAIGALDLDTYGGGLWLTDTPIEDILNDIVGGTFRLDISADLTGRTLRGYIPEGTKREALQLVAFALGACVDTSGTAKIKLFLPPTGEGAEIPAQETYIGGKVSTSDMVTEVVVRGYDIRDERPNGADDKYIEWDGVQYNFEWKTVRVRNPNVTVGALEKKVEFVDCYLISTAMVQERAEAILAYYMRRNKYTFSHVMSGQKLADRATASLPWGGTSAGNIKKMKITVTGLTVSETEFLLD